MKLSPQNFFAWLFCFVVLMVFGWIVLRWMGIGRQEVIRSFTGEGVVIQKRANGDQRVQAVSGEYHFTVPAYWMVELIGADGIAIYPMNGASSSRQCKLQFSVFDDTRSQSLEDWMAAYFREDPTVAVRQTSLEAVTLTGTEAVRWTGSVDDKKIIAVYAARAGKIYEIVPSSLDARYIAPDACVADFDRFLSLLSFKT